MRCPYEEITDETQSFARICRFAAKGVMPVAGGYHDQTVSFIEGFEEYERCEAIAKAEAGSTSDDD